ncbi:MAG: exosortase A [Erythrobacter sp.]|uniref:exosortase A n=1 Tax=Erythrobacter sp. TaxID=1042 RepID=UPI003264E54A
MPHKVSLENAAAPSFVARFNTAWREAIALLAFGALAIVTVTMREWAEMLHQWWNIDTYSHILLVPVIIGWLVALKVGELTKMDPRPWMPGLLIVAAGLGLLLLGRVSGANLVAHAGGVGALQGLVIAALGPRASAVIALPLCFGIFLVPFGDEIIEPLQATTAHIAIALTKWSGIPAHFDGIYIDTPVGLFVVAEACSGVRFLIAMVTLAVLVAFTRFTKWAHRTAFLAVSIIVPIIANGIRAWGTVYVAQSQGVEFASGFDHVFYGWFFFAFVVVLILGLAWRFFDREPEDYGWTATQTERFALLNPLEFGFARPLTVLAGVLALSVLVGFIALIAAQATLS